MLGIHGGDKVCCKQHVCGWNLNNLLGYGVMLLEVVVVDCFLCRSCWFHTEAVSYLVFRFSHPSSKFGGAVNVRAQHATKVPVVIESMMLLFSW
jgi:hypothetical protein